MWGHRRGASVLFLLQKKQSKARALVLPLFLFLKTELLEENIEIIYHQRKGGDKSESAGNV